MHAVYPKEFTNLKGIRWNAVQTWDSTSQSWTCGGAAPHGVHRLGGNPKAVPEVGYALAVPSGDHMSPRRYFSYGTLLAGVIPPGGFGSTPSLKSLGYKSPNEKLNIAGIGAGGRPFSDLTAAEAGVENRVALADVDVVRGAQGYDRWPKADKCRDSRRMLYAQRRQIVAVVIGTADHMHATCALACMQLGKHVYVENPLTRTAWEARLLTQAAEKYKVATQMGNQGYSHDATRVACEILWSGEIGEVREVHAWTGAPGWPQEMQRIPSPTAV